MKEEMKFNTLAIHGGQEPDKAYGAVMPPIYQTSTYAQTSPGKHKGYEYSRSGNPTRHALEQALASIEKGVFGMAFASGLAAMDAVIKLLGPGDEVIATHDLYGGSYRLFRQVFEPLGIRFRFTDMRSVEGVAALMGENTRLIWVETPSNPLLRITDIGAIAAAAHDAGALVVADNTFLSPVGQSPLELGADVVLHSTTKYINGHSDVVGGAVVAKDPALVDQLRWWANCLGLTGSPFDSFQTLRGLRTLNVRYRKHEENAAAVVDFLAGHPLVAKVYYPGLEGHPGHEVAARQQKSFGAMISFELDADAARVPAFLDALRLFTLAESLGGVESLVAHPATMTHAAMPEADQLAAGISPRLLRLSIGIEHADDLLHDLGQALEALSA